MPPRRPVRSPTWLFPATGRRTHGQPGAYLHQRLSRSWWRTAPLLAALLLGGLLFHQWLAALLLSGMVVALHAQMTQAQRYRWQRGLSGEVQVGRALSHLPDCTVFHDYPLGRENADHVIVTAQGLFTLEVKNYAGVQATAQGLFYRGEACPQILQQARRQAAKVARLTQQRTVPIVVFCDPRTRLRVSQLEGVHLTTLSQLCRRLTALRRSSELSLDPDVSARALLAALESRA